MTVPPPFSSTRLPQPAADADSLRSRFDVVETSIDCGGWPVTIAHPRSAEALIDEAAFNHDARLPYWADIWPSARVLAAHVVRHHGDGRSAIELGCGVGLVACAMTVAGYRVTATDYYPEALEFTRANALRSCGRELDTRLVDWRALPDDLGTFAFVAAADVLYERAYAELVAEVIDRLLAPGGSAMIADPGRLPLEAFLAESQRRGLALDDAWDVPFVDGPQKQTIRLHALVRR